MSCKHELVKMKDGSLDKICLKCGKKFKQGQLTINPTININVNIKPDTEQIKNEIIKGVEGVFLKNHYLGKWVD